MPPQTNPPPKRLRQRRGLCPIHRPPAVCTFAQTIRTKSDPQCRRRRPWNPPQRPPWTQLLRGLSPSSATPSNPSTPLKSPRIQGQAPWPGSPPAVRTKPRTPELRSPGMTAAEQTPLPDLPSIPEKASAPQKRPTSQYKFKPQSPTRPRTQPRPTPPETPPLHRTPQRR